MKPKEVAPQSMFNYVQVKAVIRKGIVGESGFEITAPMSRTYVYYKDPHFAHHQVGISATSCKKVKVNYCL
jgi:hypothetical protein